MSTYTRVIPRDFFNEAKLLKCMGHLSVKIIDNFLPENIKIFIEECGDEFKIRQLDSGELWVSNYDTTVNSVPVRFCSAYNSKSNFPLFCEDGDEYVLVFDEDGNFTEEFINHFT